MEKDKKSGVSKVIKAKNWDNAYDQVINQNADNMGIPDNPSPIKEKKKNVFDQNDKRYKGGYGGYHDYASGMGLGDMGGSGDFGGGDGGGGE